MNAQSNDTFPFEVFYDGHCPLCFREIELIRRKDTNNRMKLTDISAAEFSTAPVGKTRDQLMREIHGRYADGSFVVGVDVFREIYGRLGLGWLVRPTRWGIFRWPLSIGYRLFASLRYRAALKRFNKNSCQIPLGAFPDSTPESSANG